MVCHCLFFYSLRLIHACGSSKVHDASLYKWLVSASDDSHRRGFFHTVRLGQNAPIEVPTPTRHAAT